MFLNTKTFYPVGQGGFYSERIWNGEDFKTIVYDCGSDTGKKSNGISPLEKCIDESGIESVDCVVISHLDRDHINGIPYLKKYLKKICPESNPLLILPKPNPCDVLLFLEDAAEEKDDEMLNFFVDDIMDGERVLYITPDDDDLDDALVSLESPPQEPRSHSCNFIFGGVGNSCKNWLLKFYVDPSKYAQMNEDNVKKIEEIMSLDDFEKRKSELKRIYRDCILTRNRCGNADASKSNLSSMSMISAPFDNSVLETSQGEKQQSFASWMNGDISLKSDKELESISNHYKDFLNLNFDFQIPHHGSERNLEKLPDIQGRIRPYIWAGLKNKHKHPSYSILQMLKQKGLVVNWISENDNVIIHREKWL